jgi:hypothetical protein
MTWILTAQGREHHLSGFSQQLNKPDISEIAHALAQINRFSGHCKRPYSVAEHSVLVAGIAQSEGASTSAQLAALLHDAHEAYTGDMSSPAKWAVGMAWEVFETSQAIAVHSALGMSTAMFSHRANVKRWDLIALSTERRDLTRFVPAMHKPWPMLDNPNHPVQPIGLDLMAEVRREMRWSDWLQVFIEKYDELLRKLNKEAKLQPKETPHGGS